MRRPLELLAGGTPRDVASPFEVAAEEIADWLVSWHRVVVCGLVPTVVLPGRAEPDPCGVPALVEHLRAALGDEVALRRPLAHHSELHDRGEEILALVEAGRRVPTALYGAFVASPREFRQALVEPGATTGEMDGI
jgi:hypothetical protein